MTILRRPGSRWTRLGLGLAISFVGLSGCEKDDPVAPESRPEASTGAPAHVRVAGEERLITSDPVVMSAALKSVGNENELQVVLKDTNRPRISLQALKSAGVRSRLPVGVPATGRDAPRRSQPGFAVASAATREALKIAIKKMGAEVYREYTHVPMISIRLQESNRTEVIARLLSDPTVDYIEANGRRRVEPTEPRTDLFHVLGAASEPTPPSSYLTLPTDLKHTFHRVRDTDPSTEDAWDITRGTGVTIAILDSGMAGSFPGSGWHDYGQLLSATSGIEKIGVADDYNACSIPDQQVGACEARDDERHGTRMAGLVGANDNNQFVLGVAPDALTVSLKISINCLHPDASCFGSSGDDFVLEDDDFQAAIDWAIGNGVDVLSMSWGTSAWPFGSGMSATSEFYLSVAYNGNDILLLASTGNEDAREFPVEFSAVMGVGGLLADGNSVWQDTNEEVSALSAGTTLTASSCHTGTFSVFGEIHEYCDPIAGTSFSYSSGTGSGGTSASAAIAAGIAGLVRAANPQMSAPQVRQRLINTVSNLGTHQLDAWRAVTNTPVLRVEIDGPTCVEAGENTWTADVTGGRAPFSYTWREQVGGAVVSSTSAYQRFVDENETDFDLVLEVRDDPGQIDTAFESIEVGEEGGGPETLSLGSPCEGEGEIG